MEKKKVGRPPLEQTMNTEWYNIIIDAGRTGKHITQFLIEIGISWEGHSKLLKRNPKYNEAVGEYNKLCENYWYNMAHNSMADTGGAGFNSRLWALIMKNKFGNNWTDQSRVDITTQGDKIDISPIQIEIIKSRIDE